MGEENTNCPLKLKICYQANCRYYGSSSCIYKSVKARDAWQDEAAKLVRIDKPAHVKGKREGE
jgi:hypothetical protein